MDEDFQYEGGMPEYVEDEEIGDEKIWDAEIEDLEDYLIEAELESNIVKRFIAILRDDRKCLFPLICGKLIRAAVLPSLCTREVWDQLPHADKYNGWAEWMAEYSAGQLSRIATRLLTTCVYTSDGGFHFERYGSYGRRDILPPCEWKRDVTLNKDVSEDYVVAVSRPLEACGLAAGATVKLRGQTAYKYEGDDGPQAYTKYDYVNKTSEKVHPQPLKAALRSFLAVPAGTKLTTEIVKTRGFIWEAMARKICSEKVLTPDMTPLNVFHFIVSKPYPVPKLPIDERKVMSIDLDMANYLHVIHKSWFTGGMYLRNESFLTYIHSNLFPDCSWSGNFPKSLPCWADRVGAKFERGSASLGDPNLSLVVKNTEIRNHYTGVVWNPTGAGKDYENAIGIAIPVSGDFHSCAVGINWCGFRAAKNLMMTAICGVRPFILIIEADHMNQQAIPHFIPFSTKNLDLLWKKIPAVCFLNFVINFNTIYHGEYGSKPIILFAGNPDSVYRLPPATLPLARYLQREESHKGKTALEVFDSYFAAGAADRAAKRAHESAGDTPGSKRSKK